ncbi:Wiskott-Aldrich syndrome protein family member 3 [Toxocara canis]|uniref:Wiskott-Aldrich syndrome protein family member n=1 Tax=Toxocara canis TaxID=6265 RepID=A0A0B2VDP3_TOXCA|nr:Wiskott-Aldrich syndrome protein family member 3 [Toxocara canis]
MPLTKRAVSPVNVSLHRLPASMQTDELECVANGTLANLVRQLSSLSRHAEHIFGEIYHEAVKIDHKTNTMAQRIERLTHKVTQLDCNQEQDLEGLYLGNDCSNRAEISFIVISNGYAFDRYKDRSDRGPGSRLVLQLQRAQSVRSTQLPELITTIPRSFLNSTPEPRFSLEDLHMRKPFKSSALIDQHTLDRQTLPSALGECYASCDRPPNLDALNPYRDDKKSALKYYTDPSYFFDLWRQEMLKDMGDGRRARTVRSPTDNKSPSRKKRNRQSAGTDAVRQAPLSSRYYTDPSYFFDLWRQEMLKDMGDGRRARTVRSPTDNKSPSRKKRNRQSAGTDAVRQAPLSSRYVAATQQRPSEIMHFPAEYQAPQILRMEQVQAPVGMSVPTSNGYTPPPATATAPVSLPSPIPEEVPAAVPASKSISHQLAHLELHDDPLLDDDDLPPPPPPLMHTSLSAVVGSFANATATDEPKADKTAVEQTTRSNLLAEIQSGIKLKQVQRKEQAAEEKAAAEANDVAAILRRRMEHVLGNSDSNTDSQSDDDEEWD